LYFAKEKSQKKMKNNCLFIFVFAICSLAAQGQTMFFSAQKGTLSKPQKHNFLNPKLIGNAANQFVLNDTEVIFCPKANFVGTALAYVIDEKTKGNTELKGLSTRALEGENEAPLYDILQLLNYNIDLGWTSLANHLMPEPQSQELEPSLFVRASSKPVTMRPIARYSPAFELPFGLFSLSGHQVMANQFGVLAGSEAYPEHQTIFPALASGNISQKIGKQAFGFYCTSPSHTAYSIDALNQPNQASHAVRIYKAINNKGKVLKYKYIVCFEEAKNGDYQDYVFLLENVKPSLK
jgi:hypothetical protein